LYLNTIKGQITWPQHISPVAKDLLSKFLHRRPEERLGSRGIQDIKSHPFFTGLDWSKLEVRGLQPPFKPPPTDEKWNLDEPDYDDPTLLNEWLRNNSVENIEHVKNAQGAFPDFTFSERSALDSSPRLSVDSLRSHSDSELDTARRSGGLDLAQDSSDSEEDMLRELSDDSEGAHFSDDKGEFVFDTS
jgi:hypothetical protein